MYTLTIRYHQTLNLKKSPLDPFLVVIIKNNSQEGNKLARSNYQFNKRQKELTLMSYLHYSIFCKEIKRISPMMFCNKATKIPFRSNC